METLENVYKGSEKTFQMVYSQLVEKYGVSEADKYNPLENCLTMSDWNKLGKKIKKGEKAIKSITWIPASASQAGGKPGNRFTGSDETGAEKKGGKIFPKTVNLYYYLQVETMSEKFKEFLEAKKNRFNQGEKNEN